MNKDDKARWVWSKKDPFTQKAKTKQKKLMRAELSIEMLKCLNYFLSVDRFVSSKFDQKHFV